ncbi:PLP-dependent transferase [Rhizodiscina lignyota]|uniref:PLP-dependent transferase n=1 Tax=Rhizodiscina lignyota TaxID=1504668 RepID=A0A9P4MB25_9PEZI|nr:PLP-dependent transferase [Rhizodiscina lignyota]
MTSRTIQGLSERGTALAISGGIRDRFGSVLGDPFHAESNPKGFVNIGTSESYTMLPEVTKFANERVRFEERDFSYGDGPWGSERLRCAMAKHMNKHFQPVQPVDPSDILFSNGVTSLCEQLGFSIAEAGDGIMFTRPIYQAFRSDFGTRAKITPVWVSFRGDDQFTTSSIKHWEAAYDQASKDGITIRAVMLCNPHNPLGRCYPKSLIIALMEFCQKRKLHLLSDEIYASSVYDVPSSDVPAVPFISVLSFDTTPYIDTQYLHVLYGMSKDFASGGLRLGCIYTRNEHLFRAMGAMSQFHWLCNPAEKLAAVMLESEEWMEHFQALSRKRLAERNSLTRRLLDDLSIGYSAKSNAGFFIWADLRRYLPSIARDGRKICGWEAEEELMEMLRENGVFMTPGNHLSADEPGFFRIIFSQEESVLKEGMRRVGETIARIEKE